MAASFMNMCCLMGVPVLAFDNFACKPLLHQALFLVVRRQVAVDHISDLGTSLSDCEYSDM